MPRLHIVKPKKSASVKAKVQPTKRTKSGLSASESKSLKKLKPAPPLDRKVEALKRLGVSSEAVAAIPEISGLLRQARGGLKQVLEAMRFSHSDDVRAFLAVYDAIPAKDRSALAWEAIALKAGVDPTMLLGSAILALQDHSKNAVKIIALSGHPGTVRARVAFGMLPGGVRDRDALDTSMGLLPTSKGSTIIIDTQGRGGREEAQSPILDVTPEDRSNDLEHLFPSLSATQDRLVPAKARLLEGGS